jgi:hypothetical protein
MSFNRDTDELTYQPYRDGMGSLKTHEGKRLILSANTPQQLNRGIVERTKGLIICQNPHPEHVKAWDSSRKGTNPPTIYED